MPKKAHTEEQIVAVLRQVEAGARVDDVCRKVGISQATYYLWKRKYTGVAVSELRELRQLREEVGRLKRLVADLSLDRQMLQEIVSKKCMIRRDTASKKELRTTVCENVSGLLVERGSWP
jgi:putative transposase